MQKYIPLKASRPPRASDRKFTLGPRRLLRNLSKIQAYLAIKLVLPFELFKN